MYTVKIKRKNQFFWRTIKNVIEDGFVTNDRSMFMLPVRFFILKDRSRIEVSMTDTEIRFMSDRADTISKQMANKKTDVVRSNPNMR